MTTIPQGPYAHAEHPTPAEHHVAEEPGRRIGRAWLAGALVFVGGYLVLTSLASQLPMALAGFAATGPAVTVLLAAQFAFAILVVLLGILSAPGSTVGKLAGALVVIVGIPVVLGILTLRLSGAFRAGPEVSFTIANPWLMTVLIVGVAWLLARRARLGWLALLGVIVLSPLQYALFMLAPEPGVLPLIMFTLSALVGAGILLAGRPWRD